MLETSILRNLTRSSRINIYPEIYFGKDRDDVRKEDLILSTIKTKPYRCHGVKERTKLEARLLSESRICNEAKDETTF